MIRKYTFGNGIETEAIVQKIENSVEKVPYLLSNSQHTQYVYYLDNNDIVYGLGENVRGINKRGWIYQSKCEDNSNHLETSTSLYGAHNFLVVKGKKTFGLFFDYPGVITFDIGYETFDRMVITLTDEDYDLYVIEGETVKDIVHEFRQIIGRSYIPPKWAFGYGQSRWGYKNEEDVREVVSSFENNEIPLDSIYLDIDYMSCYKDFTVNQEAFPDLKALITECKEKGVHIVPIIDAGIKIEQGYSTYEEGVNNNFFCKNEDGTDFTAAVWPGKVHFPDVLNEDARKWFGQQYAALLEQGVDGFWNDMNEPSIFYTEKRLNHVLEGIGNYNNKDLDLQEYWDILGSISSLGGNEEDFKTFYHNINGTMVRHDKVHNLYGYNITRAAGEAFEQLEPEKRLLLFSRSSYIGMHRYGGIWTGDNKSWWNHILLNLHMLPSLNMCGFMYVGADLGGFGENTTEDLMIRWMELGIFTPLMRNHSALNTRRQEPYQFERVEVFRNIIELRYGLLPYLYSEYVKAVLENRMLFQPLAFEYEEDAGAVQVEDQLLVGESIMIAPVYVQNATGRYVYLPEDMKLVKFLSLTQYEERMLEKGYHYIDIALEEVAIFIRPGHLLPLSRGGKNVEAVESKNLTLIACDDNRSAAYKLYDDDGYGKDFENPAHYTMLYHFAED